jgi:hypothetical protein
MNKLLLAGGFFLLVLAVIAAAILGGKKLAPSDTEKLGNKVAQEEAEIDSRLPIAKDNSIVQSATKGQEEGFLQYFFSGKIAGVEKVAGGTKILIEGADSSTPVMIVPEGASVQKITQISDVPRQTENLPVDILKEGNIVDIRMDYKTDTEQWFFKEIFLPAERNPQ